MQAQARNGTSDTEAETGPLVGKEADKANLSSLCPQVLQLGM